MSQLVEILVPDIGNFDSVDVIEVLVKPGDSVAKEDPLITLESDKASMDIPAPEAGTVKEVKLKVGDKVLFGDSVGQDLKWEGEDLLVMREAHTLGVFENA